MSPERLEELRKLLTKLYDHVYLKGTALELLTEVYRLRAELDQHAAWAAERIEMNEARNHAKHNKSEP